MEAADTKRCTTSFTHLPVYLYPLEVRWYAEKGAILLDSVTYDFLIRKIRRSLCNTLD